MEPTESTILLRAVALQLHAGDVLYIAASMLSPAKNAGSRAANRAVIEMTVRLLGLPDHTNPEVVERVLRNLPNPESERTR